MKLKIIDKITVLLILFCIGMIILNPQTAKSSVISGLMLCSNVVIPSLFPFTVCVLMLMNTEFNILFRPIEKFTQKLFDLNSYEFSLLILSMLGGYPIGAKLISKSYEKKEISEDKAQNLLCFCVNAGPGFIILAVGNGILNSKILGTVLFFSHILSSFIIAAGVSAISRKKGGEEIKHTFSPAHFTDSFVSSTSDAATSMINICSYILIFSVICGFINGLSPKNPLSYLKYILEVTTALTYTKNVYLISFLLGFSGICVLCQVFAVSRIIKVNLKKFIVSRVLHGVLSVLLTKVFVLLFKISTQTVFIDKSTDYTYFYKTPSLAISLVIMVIVFFISVRSKKIGRNLKEDLL